MGYVDPWENAELIHHDVRLRAWDFGPSDLGVVRLKPRKGLGKVKTDQEGKISKAHINTCNAHVVLWRADLLALQAGILKVLQTGGKLPQKPLIVPFITDPFGTPHFEKLEICGTTLTRPALCKLYTLLNPKPKILN